MPENYLKLCHKPLPSNHHSLITPTLYNLRH
jgi:hypothetical protein